MNAQRFHALRAARFYLELPPDKTPSQYEAYEDLCFIGGGEEPTPQQLADRRAELTRERKPADA